MLSAKLLLLMFSTRPRLLRFSPKLRLLMLSANLWNHRSNLKVDFFGITTEYQISMSQQRSRCGNYLTQQRPKYSRDELNTVVNSIFHLLNDVCCVYRICVVFVLRFKCRMLFCRFRKKTVGL